MMLNYYPEPDSLYIDLSPNPSVESRIISDGVVLDYDEAGNLVGMKSLRQSLGTAPAPAP